MQKKNYACITGLGAYLPDQILTNLDLEKMVETSDEWIMTRTGIQERRIAKSDEFCSHLGAKAAENALNKAKLNARDVDAILVSTMTPDFLTPSTAALIQHSIGATNACALDIQAACTGFLYALSIAKSWVESGAFRNVLIISCEKNSAFVDYTDRNMCVLWGDGAGACVVQNKDPGCVNGYAIRHVTLGAGGEHADLFEIPAGGSRCPTSLETIAQKQHYMKMMGKEVFKHAVRRMESTSKDCLDAIGLKEEEISWIVPHQANIRIIEALAKRFNTPWERVIKTIHKYGNTSSATIPIALAELDDQSLAKKDENLLLTAFGAGLTWGASVLTKCNS